MHGAYTLSFTPVSRTGKIRINKAEMARIVISVFLLWYFPVLEKSLLTGYMLQHEGCPRPEKELLTGYISCAKLSSQL